jgi:hypothetical protein
MPARCALTDERLFTTADLACSMSGRARVRFGTFFLRDFRASFAVVRHPA